MNLFKTVFIAFVISIIFQNCSKDVIQHSTVREIWTKEKANEWYQNQGWLVGANYIPSYAINQLEMWQEESFDTITIEREFVLAENLGMNTMRVFLHDLLHQQDSTGFYNRINIFLRIADRHKIKPMFVFFDSCWDPFPKAGKQVDPKPFVHNSGWVQSPGQNGLKDSTQYERLEKYVKGVIRHFATDIRVLVWDVWNEPDYMAGAYNESSLLPNKLDYVLPLLRKSFLWAREANPVQPITSPIWLGDWSSDEVMKPVEKLQVEQSDIITFHNYSSAVHFESLIQSLQRFGKPILCTEYMARPLGSTFETILPIGKKHNVGMYNWGLVQGKSQTIFPWESWTVVLNSDPALWFHDIFRTDGTPFNMEETAFIRMIIKN